MKPHAPHKKLAPSVSPWQYRKWLLSALSPRRSFLPQAEHHWCSAEGGDDIAFFFNIKKACFIGQETGGTNEITRLLKNMFNIFQLFSCSTIMCLNSHVRYCTAVQLVFSCSISLSCRAIPRRAILDPPPPFFLACFFSIKKITRLPPGSGGGSY